MDSLKKTSVEIEPRDGLCGHYIDYVNNYTQRERLANNFAARPCEMHGTHFEFGITVEAAWAFLESLHFSQKRGHFCPRSESGLTE
jgi:hypothetical protein